MNKTKMATLLTAFIMVLSVVMTVDFSTVMATGGSGAYAIMTSDATLFVATVDGDGVYSSNGTPISFGDYTLTNSTVTHLYISSAVTTLPDEAFRKFTALEEVTFASGINLQTIGEYDFAYCEKLISIEIPNSVKTIDNNAFAYCYALKSIDIPDSVTSIGGYAFRYCYALKSIDIPDSVTSIGDSAFYDCTSLTSVTIGDSVTSIGDKTFYGCTALESVTFEGDVRLWVLIYFMVVLL